MGNSLRLNYFLHAEGAGTSYDDENLAPLRSLTFGSYDNDERYACGYDDEGRTRIARMTRIFFHKLFFARRMRGNARLNLRSYYEQI